MSDIREMIKRVSVSQIHTNHLNTMNLELIIPNNVDLIYSN